MRDIFAEAQLSPGAVYRYFRGKEQIIQAMCAASSEWNSQQIQQASTQGSSAAIIQKLADTFFDKLSDPATLDDTRLSVQLWAEGVRSDIVARMVRESLERVQSRITEAVRFAQSRGDINSQLDPDSVSRVVISLFDGLLIQQSFYPHIDVAAYKQVVKALGLGDFWLGPRPAAEGEKR